MKIFALSICLYTHTRVRTHTRLLQNKVKTLMTTSSYFSVTGHMAVAGVYNYLLLLPLSLANTSSGHGSLHVSVEENYEASLNHFRRFICQN